MIIRDARDSDLQGILDIYNDVVMTTTAIYDETVSTLEQRRAWFDARRSQGLPVLVGEEGGEVIGFSSFGEWRARWGYRFTVEHSVHVRADQRGRGHGRALIEALAGRLAAQADSNDIQKMHSLLDIVARKASLVSRLQKDVQLQSLIQFWLYLHLPLCFALLVALAAHIIAVFFYW
jgi:L-amino acid N-acyltransferase YncA